MAVVGVFTDACLLPGVFSGPFLSFSWSDGPCRLCPQLHGLIYLVAGGCDGLIGWALCHCCHGIKYGKQSKKINSAMAGAAAEQLTAKTQWFRTV